MKILIIGSVIAFSILNPEGVKEVFEHQECRHGITLQETHKNFEQAAEYNEFLTIKLETLINPVQPLYKIWLYDFDVIDFFDYLPP